LAGVGIPFGEVVLPNALGVTSFVGFDFGMVQYFWLPVKLEQSGARRPSFFCLQPLNLNGFAKGTNSPWLEIEGEAARGRKPCDYRNHLERSEKCQSTEFGYQISLAAPQCMLWQYCPEAAHPRVFRYRFGFLGCWYLTRFAMSIRSNIDGDTINYR
jgi:hypothetical protein